MKEAVRRMSPHRRKKVEHKLQQPWVKSSYGFKKMSSQLKEQMTKIVAMSKPAAASTSKLTCMNLPWIDPIFLPSLSPDGQDRVLSG